ncbi:MAG: hypothetical protein IJU35_02960 [Paludibacteraceae bacterium]|nr:hypothetical protein [Paludibacteraceae bacterium]
MKNSKTYSILFCLVLLTMSAAWMMMSSICRASVAPQNTEIVTIHGTLRMVAEPCFDDGPCTDCMTVALLTEDKTYYLTDLDERWDSWLNFVYHPIPATITGTVAVVSGYNYLLVRDIVLDKPASLCDEWTILRVNFSDGTPRYYIRTESLTTDTLISHDSYLTDLYVKLEDNGYKGAIREDENGAIYYVPKGSTHEYLLYDFSAEVGDQFSNLWFGGAANHCPNGYKATVADITVVDGRKRFTLNVELSYGTMTATWIEGIGSPAGPSGMDCPFDCASDSGSEILCAYKNGEHVYSSPTADKFGCNYELYANYFPVGMKWTSLAYPWGFENVYYQEMKVTGETEIDGLVYKNIGTHLVRVEGKKVYVRINSSQLSEELLLYDFGLNIGDSIKANYVGWYNAPEERWHKVVAVDNILLLNGTLARQLKYDDNMTDIEYIGTSSGDFFRAISALGPIYEGSVSYLCCSVGDELLYEFTPHGCSYEPNDQTAVEPVTRQRHVRVVWRDNTLHIVGESDGLSAKVFAATGQLLTAGTSDTNELRLPLAENYGIVIVAVATTGGIHYIKIPINN